MVDMIEIDKTDSGIHLNIIKKNQLKIMLSEYFNHNILKNILL